MTVMQEFRTTRWSLVAALRDPAEPTARAALAELCAAYWYPVYIFIRRSGHDAVTAQDSTQGFFTQLLEKGGLSSADRGKGKFRSYVLGACRHYLSNERDYSLAAKRGGGQTPISIDFPDAERRYLIEPADDRTPDQLFERRWALTLLDRTLEGLREEYVEAGNAALFDQLKQSLTGDGASHAAVAAELGMTEGAVKVAAHRLRHRYRDKLREAISDTVESDAEVDQEIRDLFRVLG